MSGRDHIALITGAHGFGVSAVLLASLAAIGVSVVNLEDDREHETRRRNRALLDRIDILDMAIGNGARDSGLPSRWDAPPRREVAFNDTPKPMSKRRARRLRGRSAA